MTTTLQARIHALIHQVLASGPGAWMVWCDPRGHWAPLLRRAAGDGDAGDFTLLVFGEETAGESGSPWFRRELQARLDAGESFVLLVPAPPERLGWLWAQALLAERIYARSLREQLLDWGWRPQSLTIGEEELAVLARQGFEQDPAAWGGGGLQPDVALLLEVLAGSLEPTSGHGLILELTIEQAGLPALDPHNLPGWRARALARLLVTQAHAAAPDLVPTTHELLIPAPQRAFALELLDRWTDSLRLSKHLPEAILEADRIADLAAQMGGAGVDHGPFLSHAAERAVFAAVCTQLAQQSGRALLEAIAALSPDVERHARGFWGSDSHGQQAIPWDELLRLSRAVEMLLEASPESRWATPATAIEWYVSTGWRVDHAGEELLRNLTRPSPELLTLITPLRAAYRTRWEGLMIQWSEVWVQAGCPLPPLPTAGEWLREILQSPRATAILIVDAFRYPVAAVLAQRLNRREGAERAAVHPARAPLPSITPLGMGAALPIAEGELRAEVVEGKWQLRQLGRDENLSIAAQRRGWWQRHAGVPEDALLTVADAQAKMIPPPAQARTRLVIYDDAIDRLGHDDELEAMGSSAVLERYLAAIERLRDAGWRRVLIVTDHGYIHWPSSEERNVDPPAPDPAYVSRRALAYPAAVTFDGPQALAPGGAWRVALPRGAASFRAYGGLGYFHGGASLQEWIIPCVRIEWPLEARPVGVQVEPLLNVLSQRPRLTLRVLRSSLFIEESIAREVEVLVRAAGPRTILFRSPAVPLTPDQEQVSVALRAVEGAVAGRGTPLRIEVRDPKTEEVLAAAESTLMTELTGW